MYLKKKTPNTMKKTIRYRLQRIQLSTLSTSLTLSDSSSSNVENVIVIYVTSRKKIFSSQKSDPILKLYQRLKANQLVRK